MIPDQLTWGVAADLNETLYTASVGPLSVKQFLAECDINPNEYPRDLEIRAYGQVSFNDPTCILFDG